LSQENASLYQKTKFGTCKHSSKRNTEANQNGNLTLSVLLQATEDCFLSKPQGSAAQPQQIHLTSGNQERMTTLCLKFNQGKNRTMNGRLSVKHLAGS